jgi:hypothetical protein
VPEIYSPQYGYFITHMPGELLFIGSLILGGLIAWDAISEVLRR